MIRLELLKMAQQALDNEYFQKVDLMRNDWNNRTAAAMSIEGSNPPPAPTLPSIYSMEDIVAKAKILNDFVSQGQ
jgi:hypothetical protein